MGEIGRDRCETLYDMSWCEMMLIIRGYFRRNALQYQLQRITAFSAFFSNRDNKGTTPQQFIPLYVDDYITNDEQSLSEDEVDELMAEMEAINANIRNEKNK